MAYELIEVRIEAEKVGIITLNRPKALNALNSALMDELGAALKDFDANEAIGCMIVTGSEKAFAAGADISAPWRNTALPTSTRTTSSPATGKPSARIRKPVIAAVGGFALGGGCELAMMCDFIIAADNAKFGQPEIKIGIIPGAGGTQRLPRAVGKSKAMDMVLTGRMMDATEAERAGLVSRVVPLDKLMDEALRGSPHGLRPRPAGQHGRQGMREPLFRERTDRRRDVRAPPVPRLVCHRRPERRHGCVPEQTARSLHPQLTPAQTFRYNSARW